MTIGHPQHREGRQLFGRSGELAALHEAVEALAGGQGRALFITGEPGIGKSSLARTAADAAGARGLPVFWGFAWESGGAPAYWPWTQLLDQVAGHFRPPTALLSGVARILGTGADAAEPVLNPEQARFRLLESMRALVASVSARSPLVMILEDLHAADSDSLELLHHLVRHVRSLPVLVIGTFRDVEARALAAAEPLWLSVRDATVLQPQRLAAGDVREFLRATGHADPGPDFVANLLATTSGNPLFVTELAGMLAAGCPADTALPVSIQQVIGRHLDQLPGETLRALDQAAVLGRRFLPDLLRANLAVSATELSSLLAPAFAAQVLANDENGRIKFIHVLYRDVIYQRLDSTEREAAHLAQARQLEQLMTATGENRLAKIAQHLASAGEAHRHEAVDAWRKAAAHALQQLAFTESVRLYRRALDSFGDGPHFSPEARCRLLLELAAALLQKGDVDPGRDYCRQAFALARAIDDTGLMADAALTYGSVFVVAKIDSELVDMLEETYERTPADRVAVRARILARLAAAKQPAPDPGEPMEMARTAIELARSTADDRVLFEVLKSAVSALLDFAPARERVALNTEFLALARRFRSVPDQFRSNLRLMMDAAEMGDRKRLDELVDACDRIAERLDLPHYQWRVCSARAMQASIDGDFAVALQRLDEAADLAGLAQDPGAKITLPIQRFAILYEWDDPRSPSFEELEQQFAEAFALVPEAELYARPMFASFAYRTGRTVEGRSVLDPDLVERFFAGKDRFCLSRLAEVAAEAGERELAQRACAALLPFRNECGTMGIMGMYCMGPVAMSLGQVASVLDDTSAALDYYREALAVGERMRARPAVARCHQALADLENRAGNADAAARHAQKGATLVAALRLRRLRGPAAPTATAATPDAVPRLSVNRDGDVWRVEFDGRSARLRNTRGMQMLARLFAVPDREVHVLDLAGSGKAPIDRGGSGPALDAKARTEYQRRLEALGEELEEAEALGDIGRLDAAREERDFITRELSRAFGLGGRERDGGSAAERARVNVRRRLKDAIERIESQLPGAGRYLESTVKTGTYCKYAPM